MSTIDASRDHRCSRTPNAEASPSHRHIVRRTLSYASIGPLGSAARRAGITLGIVIGSALLVASSAVHLELWSMGYRNIPTIGPLFLVQAIAGTLLAGSCCCRGDYSWSPRPPDYDRHHRRIATERLCRTVRFHGFPGDTVRRSVAGSRERRSRCPYRCRDSPCTWAWSLRPTNSAHGQGEDERSLQARCG